ncbi:MAG TPA: universal stress protein [Longimicrobiales bacterium]|nr:universal stress protein [Longimicrobiales bacterium]
MIYPIQSLVAGIADLDDGDPVLGEVLELARRTRAHLHLVHAFELPSLAWDAYGRMGYMDPDVLEQYANSLRDRLAHTVAEQGGYDDVSYHAVAAPSATAIRDVALNERADLIVVGATRHGAVARVLLGTTAQRVLRGAKVPILVLRQHLTRTCHRALLTTDLSPFSAGVHELGLDVLETMCEGHRPEVRTVLVVRSSMGLPAPFRFDQLQEMAEGELKKFIEQRRERASGITGVVRFGDPVEEIAAEADAWKPDVVLVGTHSRTTSERWLLGSVAEAAIRSITANVLVIPAKAEEQRELPIRRTAETAVVAPPKHD